MKRIFAFVLSVCLIMTGLSVYADEESELRAIKISLNSNVMSVGETQKITVSVLPSGALVKLKYESDNPDVVTAAIGTVIAKSEGTANITVTADGTDISDTLQITVKNAGEEDKTETVYTSKITPENKTIYLERYDYAKIRYTVLPENAGNTDVYFESSNTSVVTVDKNGSIYGRKAGNATVTLTTADGKTTASVKVYVTEYDDDSDDSYLRSVYITHDDETVGNKFEIMEKESVTFGIKTYPSSGNKSVKWRSSNTKIAAVDQNGKVTAVRSGTCTIYATSTVNKSVSDSVTVIVTDYVRYPDRITVTPQEGAVFETGNKIKFTANVYPDDTTEREIYWRATGGAIIDQNGVLSITDKGEIKVYAYSKNYKTVGEYSVNALYSKDHFKIYGAEYNVPQNRSVIITFDTAVSYLSAHSSIFASSDETGNGERINVYINVSDNTVTVSPSALWQTGDVYIFIKGTLSDTNGNMLGRGMKYKLKVRGVQDGK